MLLCIEGAYYCDIIKSMTQLSNTNLKKKCHLWVVLLFGVIGSLHMSVSFAQSSEPQVLHQLLNLINERFSLMEQTAAIKLSQNLPTYDPAREQHVLADLRDEANDYGLELSSLQQFVQAQMRINVELQNHWHRKWSKEKFDVSKYFEGELNQTVRPRLNDITHKMVAALDDLLDEFDISEHQEQVKNLIDTQLDAPFLTQHHKDQVFYALSSVKRD